MRDARPFSIFLTMIYAIIIFKEVPDCIALQCYLTSQVIMLKTLTHLNSFHFYLLSRNVRKHYFCVVCAQCDLTIGSKNEGYPMEF